MLCIALQGVIGLGQESVLTEVSHQPCIFCDSSDAFSYNTETGLFKCFSCASTSGTERCLTYDGTTKTPFTAKAIEEGISLEPYIPDSYRGIKKSILEKYSVYFTKSEGKETVHYTYPNGTKHRELPKQIKCSGKMDKFFGQDDYNGGGKTITITEGEEDRLSVIQMMGDWPTVSVPGANPSKDFWANAQEYLRGFDEIILSVDNDDAGNKLADKIYRMFPGKVYRVPHTKYKDANEFLTNKADAEYKRAWWNKQKMKPEGFISSPDQWAEIIETENPYSYVPTPIKALNDKIRGFIRGGITVVKAPPGVGKTSVFRCFQHHLLKGTDITFAILHMEEQSSTTARGMVTYELGVNVNTKEDAINNGISEEVVKDTIRELTRGDRFITFNIDPNNAIEDTIEKIRVCREVYGADFIFLDHLQRLAYLAGVETATTQLTSLAVRIVDMTKNEDFGVIAISHVNEDGHTKYAKSVEEEAIVVIQLERDKKAENQDDRDTTQIEVTKNRPFALLGFGGNLKYDHDTTIVKEKETMSYEPNQKEQGNSPVGF